MKTLFSFILVVLFMAACHSGQHSHDQIQTSSGAEIPSLSYTVYTGNTELFAEFPALVAGDTTTLAGHFTRLGEYFQPVTDGTITFSIIVGDQTVSQTSEVSSSPGIFRYALVPAKAGTGRKVFDIKNKDYSDQVIIDNIKVFSDVKEAIYSGTAEHSGNGITYLKEQAWKVEFANMPAKRQPFSEVIKTTGEILPATGDEMMVIASANGIITFSGKTISGTPVGSGETIFSISGKNLTDGNTEVLYNQAKIARDKAKADFERAKDLVKENIVSQKEFQEIQAKYETEESVFNNLSRNYQSGQQKVTSPISGFIKTISVSDGQYVTIGQAVATVSQNRRLVLKADVSQKYFSRLPYIRSANFRTAYDGRTYSL